MMTNAHGFSAALLALCAACASTPSAHGVESERGEAALHGQVASTLNSARLEEHAHDHDSDDDHDHEPREPLGFQIGKGWLDPWLHRHASPNGTPLVHPFLTEPAFLGRDVFLTYTAEDRASALEAEIEWALTRRLGLVVEGAYEDNEVSGGFGDTFVALRALLVEQERYLISVSGEARLPTGSARKETGTGESGWAAIAHGWFDLGGWYTLQGTAGYEAIPSLDESAFIWSATFAKSFAVSPLFEGRRDPHGFVPALSLLAEVAGEDDEGLWLAGVSYSIAGDLDVRAAFSRSFEGENSWTIGVIWHF